MSSTSCQAPVNTFTLNWQLAAGIEGLKSIRHLQPKSRDFIDVCGSITPTRLLDSIDLLQTN